MSFGVEYFEMKIMEKPSVVLTSTTLAWKLFGPIATHFRDSQNYRKSLIIMGIYLLISTIFVNRLHNTLYIIYLNSATKSHHDDVKLLSWSGCRLVLSLAKTSLVEVLPGDVPEGIRRTAGPRGKLVFLQAASLELLYIVNCKDSDRFK